MRYFASRSAACWTGEHGVGVEKRDLMGTMFSAVDLAQQQRVKCAFLIPQGLLNPGKMFPELPSLRQSWASLHVHLRCQVPFPELPRF